MIVSLSIVTHQNVNLSRLFFELQFNWDELEQIENRKMFVHRL